MHQKIQLIEVKRQYTEWKKIFASHISEKELIESILKTPTIQ